MAAKKPAKSNKTLGKKTMKKTKGGILIGLNQPSFIKIDKPAINKGVTAPIDTFWKL